MYSSLNWYIVIGADFWLRCIISTRTSFGWGRTGVSLSMPLKAGLENISLVFRSVPNHKVRIPTFSCSVGRTLALWLHRQCSWKRLHLYTCVGLGIPVKGISNQLYTNNVQLRRTDCRWKIFVLLLRRIGRNAFPLSTITYFWRILVFVSCEVGIKMNMCLTTHCSAISENK